MKIHLFLVVFFLSAQPLLAQSYLKETLHYLDGTEKSVLVNKKIDGPKVKVKEKSDQSFTVESSLLKGIVLEPKKGCEIWYEYLKYVDVKGKESKKMQWLNKVIDGEVSHYMESWVAVGNAGGSDESYYMKRWDERVATKVSALKYVSQMTEYFKDQPGILEKVQIARIWSSRSGFVIQ